MNLIIQPQARKKKKTLCLQHAIPLQLIYQKVAMI